MHKYTAIRPCSNAARLWLAADRITPPIVNQMILEGTGDIDRKALEAAVRLASEANPGSRFMLRGRCARSFLYDSHITPLVKQVDGKAWDGLGDENAPFLASSFDLRKEPGCEVLIITGSPARLCFRTHHSVMDGRGTMLWVEDIFRVLRGETPLGSECRLTENDLLNLKESPFAKRISHRYLSPVGASLGNTAGFVWRRKKIETICSKPLLRIMMTVAREAWRHDEGMVRIGIPVDLRVRQRRIRSSGNLTNAIYIDVTGESTMQSLENELKHRLSARIDGELTWEDRLIRHIPLGMLAGALAREAERNRVANRFRQSAFVSHQGRVPLDRFQGGGFSARNVFFIPFCPDLIPLSVLTCINMDSLELTAAMPAVFASHGRIEAIMDAVAAALGR